MQVAYDKGRDPEVENQHQCADVPVDMPEECLEQALLLFPTGGVK